MIEDAIAHTTYSEIFLRLYIINTLSPQENVWVIEINRVDNCKIIVSCGHYAFLGHLGCDINNLYTLENGIDIVRLLFLFLLVIFSHLGIECCHSQQSRLHLYKFIIRNRTAFI